MPRFFRSQRFFLPVRGDARCAEFQPHLASRNTVDKIAPIRAPASCELGCDAVMADGSGVFQAVDVEHEDSFPMDKKPIIRGVSSRRREHKNKTYREFIMRQAKEGNVKAMERVGRLYSRGLKGFEQDDEKAFSWYAMAQKAGSVPAMAKMGELLVLGLGVDKDEAKGVMYLSLAAGKGSNFAAFLMGEYLADGTHGLDVDLVEARRMLEASLSDNCFHNHMHTEMKEDAHEKLEQVLKRIHFVDIMTTA